MDSPLLPTFQRNPDHTASPSNLLSDLSMSDPLSPADSYVNAQSSSHISKNGKGRMMKSDEAMPADDGPPKTQTKTRFSFFPRNQSTPGDAGPSSTSRTSIRSQERPSSRTETFDRGPVEEEGVGDGEGDRTVNGLEAEERRQTTVQRDEKLRSSLYELRQMNEVFDGFLGALEAARGHNLRLATRVNETSELLDRYTALLGQTEHSQRLISNPNWTGAQDDAEAIEAEEATKLAHEMALAEQAARVEQEKQAKAAKEARVTEAAGLGRGRGRGTARGGSVRGRGSGVPTSTRTTTSSKPAAETTNPKTTSGLRQPSTGQSGKYANVKSSGYGPTRKPT